MKPSFLSSLWVLEWSAKQQAFHIQTADDMIRKNWDYYFYQRDPEHHDWAVVGLAGSHQEALDIQHRLETMLDEPLG